MANKQIVAQIGVFALLGLNVGAYYVFWPHRESDSKIEAQAPAPQRGVTQLMPEKKERPAPPTKAVSLQIPNPPVPGAEKKGDDDALAKLLEHIQKETGSTSKTPPPAPEEKPAKTNQTEVNLPADPAPVDPKPANTSDAAASPVPAKPSPWLMNMEMIGNQTQLTAKLRQPALEFKILCERVEMKAPGGTVQAHGKVTVVGAGLKGSCQRLTLPLHETQLILEDQVKVVHDANLGSILRGDRIVWEPAPSTVETPLLAPPAEFRTFGPFPAILPPLDKVK